MQMDQLSAVLGEGSQNVVYSIRNDANAVVKIAKMSIRNLQKQNNFLATLADTGLFPQVLSAGTMQLAMHSQTTLSVETSYLVMQKLGISLQEFMILRQGSISVGTIRKVGMQLLQKIRVLHSFNIIHNDIKPANILFGLKDKRNELFIIDFGLAEKQPEILINCSQDDSQVVDTVFKGNIKFSSLRKLQGYKATKLDDLQGLTYLLMWMLLGGKSVSELSGLQRRKDPIQQNFRQRLQFQLQSKRIFIQNVQTLLPERVSGQKLSLSLMVCRVLAFLNGECSEHRLDFYYESISAALASHE